VLAHVIERVAACARIGGVRVATTTEPADDAVAAEAERAGAEVVRGSEQDVLDRYVQAAGDAPWIVRVTADCPLFDPGLLCDMIARASEIEASGTPIDYLTNGVEPTFPRGLDAEIVRSAALRRAHREARQPYEREHVTPYLYQHPELFALHIYRADVDRSAHRWTLDTPDDLAFVRAVYAELDRPGGPPFGRADVLALLERRPELTALNAHVQQKALGQ
jgi:spore coat polysaccharide biosynthesis protein SpsF